MTKIMVYVKTLRKVTLAVRTERQRLLHPNIAGLG